MAHESRVESVELRLRDDLAAASARKRSHHPGDLRDLQHIEPVHHGWATRSGVLRQARDLQQPAALPENQRYHPQKLGPFSDMEKLLDIPREIRVEPFGIKLPVGAVSQQGRRQTSSQNARFHVRDAESLQFLGQHRSQRHNALPPCERVSKLPTRCQRRRSSRQHAQMREGIRRNFQNPARIGQLMDFVKNHQRFAHRLEKRLGILQPPHLSRQIAVQELRVTKFLGQHRLARAPHTRQPHQGHLLPCPFQTIHPNRSSNHCK